MIISYKNAGKEIVDTICDESRPVSVKFTNVSIVNEPVTGDPIAVDEIVFDSSTLLEEHERALKALRSSYITIASLLVMMICMVLFGIFVL